MKTATRQLFCLRICLISLLCPVFGGIAESGERAAKGYLAAPGPASSRLRFAPPPKHPVAELPPIAFKGTPPQVLVSNYEERPSVNISDAEVIAHPELKRKLRLPEKATIASIADAKPVAVEQSGPHVVSPEMLLKFFSQTNMKATNKTGKKGSALSFRVPLAEGSSVGNVSD